MHRAAARGRVWLLASASALFSRRLAQLVVFTRRRTPKLSANGSRFVWTVFDRDVALQNPGSHDCCFRHGFSIVHHAVFMT